jgi:radical SAM superfamily enzyme YgiQ (UPF0313 family)
VIEQYFIGYLLHPYVSLYTGRGCRSKCTFCLWPQTVGGHRYRTRSVEHVVAEIAQAQRHFPNVKEYFFDDDTFTDDLPRAEAIARGLGRLGVTWSCNAKANVPLSTLRVLRDNGLRLLLVGYESGSQDILNRVKKGIRLDIAREFTRNARAIGIKIHGTFIMGLPGETRETINNTIAFAKELDVETIQVSVAHAYPGTELYDYAVKNGFMVADNKMVDEGGHQLAHIQYPGLPADEILSAVHRFYDEYYFRPKAVFRILKKAAFDGHERKRLYKEAKTFLKVRSMRNKLVKKHSEQAAAAAAGAD